MVETSSDFRRDLFEIENARNLTRDEVVATFVDTRSFWRLLSPKNHIVLGARGSGKTVLAKMLSHDHLSRFENPRAKSAIQSRAFIGIYLPTSLEWVGGLKNKTWQTEVELESFFQWRLNVASCLAFLVTLRSCLDRYSSDRGEAARLEGHIVGQLCVAWMPEFPPLESIRALQAQIEASEHQKQQQLVRVRATGSLREAEEPAGIGFDLPLFTPLRRAIALSAVALQLPADCSWLLCLDEAEFLGLEHQRILNSYLRSNSGNLHFKITTMPYYHLTQDTNLGVGLNVGHDFEYVYIDRDPIGFSGVKEDNGRQFADLLFRKRASASGAKYQGVTLNALFGRSELLDPQSESWDEDSANWELLRKHADEQTIARADRLVPNPSEFRNQISRKMHGAIQLREAIQRTTGRDELKVYSGASMIVRCGDANPRRLIRIINSFLVEERWRDGRRIKSITQANQTRNLIAFSTTTLSRIQSEPEVGPELFTFIERVGSFMRDSLHNRPISTDQISSFIVDASVSSEHWKLIERAVGLGLLFPNTGQSNPDQMPIRSGTFHLAYVLAPHFRILPRRGRARSLTWILAYQSASKEERAARLVEQSDLFGGDDSHVD